MAELSLEPLQAADASIDDHDSLSRLLEEEGYLFIRGLIDRGTIGRLRSDIRQLLIQDGFVVDDPGLELKWSGKMPVSDELAPIGRIGRMISDLPSLAEVIHSQELLGFLGTLFNSQVFSWVENADRVRVIFQDLAPAETGGQQFDYATPAHQDGYHFRVRFVTCWVALMDIDLPTAAWPCARVPIGRECTNTGTGEPATWEFPRIPPRSSRWPGWAPCRWPAMRLPTIDRKAGCDRTTGPETF